jgi:hypothetical protein
MALTSQPVQIVLTAADWLQIAGWLMAAPTRSAAVNHLLDNIGQQVLKDER